jgi:hypothetical protein
MTMFVRAFVGFVGLVGLSLVLAPESARSQEKVYHLVSGEKLESMLKALDVPFKKSAAKKDDVVFYDYERNNYKIRLHNYQGKDLWIDTFFHDKATLEEVNGWNTRSKFSRAVLIKNGDKANISLECQLDCLGGVTDGVIQQFINRFDSEIAAFVKYLNK